jgi:TolB-like protein/tetratricopeptide (TPR) repeat protein/tRNA A-37 threonylcarbamoyl transferase component Bud32
VPITSGSRFEGYEVIERLGSGGMGEIWLARDVTLDRMVALKVLRADVTTNPTRITRFRQEARAASSLNHPNVCTIHALGETSEGQQFIAMEHVAGATLRQRISGSMLPLRDALDIAVQVASALSTAHAAGVVHRDLKPENVMIRQDGLVKVVDFGLAKLAPLAMGGGNDTRSIARTEEGILLGTVAYMSPEQARGQEVDARTDIWSLGVILHEMLAGRPPFTGSSSSDVLAAILEHDAPPIARSASDGSAELQRILSKSLQKDREQRYQGMKDVLLDLQALRDTVATGTMSSAASEEPIRSPIDAPGEASAVVPSTGTMRHDRYIRSRGLAVAVAACLLVSIIWAVWWLVSRRSVASPQTPSVAVLPFTTIGQGDGYFADGITEAVTTELGRVGGLRVIASNTAFAYRNRTSVREVASALRVGLVVRGSVQRAGDTVRIDVSLIEARDETALWSDHYSKPATDVLAVQDEISRQIATTLSKRLGAATTAKSPALATRHPEAIDAYLRGLWHLKGRSLVNPIVPARVESWHSAVQELERSVALDPTFALAHATLASAYAQLFFYDATDRGFDERAFRAINRALDINPEQAEAYLARAQLSWTARRKFQHEAAIADLRTALSINPNLAEGYVELEKIYYHVGLTDKAVAAREQANRLDPSQAVASNRALRALVDANRTEELRRELNRHENLGAYAHADALVALGQLEEARKVLSTSRVIVPTAPDYDVGAVALLAVVYARLGLRREAIQKLDAVMPAAQNPTELSHMHHAQLHIGAVLGLLGRHEEAVHWLTRAADEGYPSYPRFATDQSLAPLKGHAGFEALLARLRQDWERRQRSL